MHTLERRKYLRLKAPIDVRIITGDSKVEKSSVVNLSPLGLRLECNEPLDNGTLVELTLILPNKQNPVHIESKVVWSREAPKDAKGKYYIGCEFVRIEEDNKNTFLKFFCDLIYGKAVPLKKED